MVLSGMSDRPCKNSRKWCILVEKMKSKISRISWIGLVLLLSGCASIDKRIEKNIAYFSELEPDVQAMIRKGQIDIGFEKPMVEIALGRPATTKRRQTAEGSTDIWVYNGVKTEWVYPRCVSYGTGIYSGSFRGRRHLYYQQLAPVARPATYEAARVVFEDGKVKEVEQLAPRN